MVTTQIAAFPVIPAKKMSVYKIVNGIAIHKSATLSPSWYKRNSSAEQLNVPASFESHRLISDDGNVSSIDDGEDVFIWLFLHTLPNSLTQSTPYRSSNSLRLKTQKPKSIELICTTEFNSVLKAELTYLNFSIEKK